MKVELFLRTNREIAAFGDFLKAVSAELHGTTAMTGDHPVYDDETTGGVYVAPSAELTAAPTRERGQPSAGRARRTKEEIAEDKAAEVADATAAATAAGFAPDKVIEPVAAISTGEERLSPEDTPEDAAADAADEAAETAATKTDKLTTEDVRNGMGIYVTKYGIEAIQLDGLEVFNRVLGPCPLKNEKGDARTWKVSDLPDDQAVLKRIVDGFAEMTSLNPFKRTAKVA